MVIPIDLSPEPALAFRAKIGPPLSTGFFRFEFDCCASAEWPNHLFGCQFSVTGGEQVLVTLNAIDRLISWYATIRACLYGTA